MSPMVDLWTGNGIRHFKIKGKSQEIPSHSQTHRLLRPEMRNLVAVVGGSAQSEHKLKPTKHRNLTFMRYIKLYF